MVGTQSVLSPNRYIPPIGQDIELNINLNEPSESKKLSKIREDLDKKIHLIEKTWKASEDINLKEVYEIFSLSRELYIFCSNLYKGLIKKYFLDYKFSTNPQLIESEIGNIPKGWEVKAFGDIFEERSRSVKEEGYCPSIYSVTNSGIQLREGKYSKELSKSTANYKIAFCGDMVFGLSRQIPNLDVFMADKGAFSPAYTIYSPKDIRIGLIIGCIMRLKLMEQTDILKGGAREGRGLDKTKLLKKLFVLPADNQLMAQWRC
jgi:hypothetical protein